MWSFHHCSHFHYHLILSPLSAHKCLLVFLRLCIFCEITRTDKVILSSRQKERWDFLITSSPLCTVCLFFVLFISSSFCPEHSEFSGCIRCPLIFLIILNFSLLLFSRCSDTVSLRRSIKFHLIWTWWNCVSLSEERSLLYLVQILNWVWCCDPAALILGLMDFRSPQMWLSWREAFVAVFPQLFSICSHLFSCWVCFVKTAQNISSLIKFRLHFSWTDQVKLWI